jgi:hypothetical protein
LTAPDGSDITVKDVMVVPGSNDTQFDISYAQQTLDGTYHIVVGPDILDQSGNEMDQNNDFIPGEVPDDQFVFNFNPLTRNLEDFEGPDLSRYQLSREQWQLSTAAAHDGNQGLSSIQTSGEWIYRNDEGAHVAQGDVISVWAQYHGDTSGRIYFGFGASSAGTLSMVLAGNTGELLIQENSGFSYNDIGTVGQTYQTGHWYRMEVTWATGGNITGRLFDSDGITLIRTVTAHTTLFTQGGIAFRGFTGGTGQIYFDTATAQGAGGYPGGAPSAGNEFGRFAQLNSVLTRGEPRTPVFSSNVVDPVRTTEVRHEDPLDGFFATRTGNDPVHDFALPSRENLLALAVREHQPWSNGLFTEENWMA